MNFDASRFVEYCKEADEFVESISSKLHAAGVKERPVAADLPWFDLHGNPINFSLKKTLKDIDVESLAKLGEEVSANAVGVLSTVLLKLILASVRVTG